MPTPPSFTGVPQLLETPAVFPLQQPLWAGSPGPYEFTGSLFWIFPELDAFSQWHLVAYRSDDLGTTQPSVRIPSTINISKVLERGVSSCSYPGSGSFLYVSYVDNLSGNLGSVVFDMTAGGSFGTPNDTSVTLNNNGSNWIFKLPNGNIQIVYDDFDGTFSNVFVYTVIWNGSSWSAPVVVGSPANTATFPILSVVAVSGSHIGIYWGENGGNVYYTVINGTSVVSQTTITTWATSLSVQTQAPITSIYDSVSDTAACLLIRNSQHDLSVLTATPSSSATPTVAVVAVGNDPTAAFAWDTGAILGNAAGDVFYAFVWDSFDNIIQVFVASSLAGPWTGPTTYYNQALHEPVPTPEGPESFPIYARYLPDGSLAVSVGFLYAIVGSPTEIFCGLVAALITPVIPPPVQTLQLIKQVSGGSAVATDWTLSAAGPTPISGAGGVGPSNVDAGTYTLTETAVTDYTLEALICVGGTQVGNQVTLAAGQSAVCTFTNLFTGVTPPPPPPPFCIPFEPTTPSPSLVAYDEPLELKGS